MGLWGLILGFVSIVSQSVSAVNTNIIREVAATDESQFKEKTNILLVNGMVIYGFFFIVLSIITLTTFSLIFYKEIKAYQGLISLVLVGMFINLLATIFSSVLDGKKLNYIKNSLQIFSNLFYLIACYFFVEPFNLFGIAMAQIVQALIMLIGISYFVFYKLHISLKISNISKSEIVLFFRESWKLQAISFFVLCYEPITKYFLSRFGLGYVAKYEIANRIITQLRNFFIASNQTLLSVFVNKFVEGKES